MNYLSIDYLIVYAFLLITLIIGLWAGRGVKDIREYAIGDKQFGTGALTVTLLATYIGGWHLFGFPSDIFADGLTHIIPELVCGVVVCFLFIAWFIAPKIVHFKNCLTMGDLMRVFYGEYGQIITGILGFVYNTTTVSIQIIFLGHIGELLGIKSVWGIIFATLTLAIYTARGGVKAVIMTDILQFTAIVAAIPLLAHLLTYQTGGIRALLSSVPQEKLQLFNFEQNKSGAFSASYYGFPTLILWMLFPGFPLSFPFIQRMFMAKSQPQSVKVYYNSIAFLVSFFLLLTIIGLAVSILYPQIDSQDVIAHTVSNLPVGLKGLVWTALLAVIMSTTDSFLHAAGVSLTHDLIKPFLKRQGIDSNELKLVQYTTFFIGCVAIAIVLSIGSISKIAIYGMDLAALLFTMPLIAGILGLKTNIRSFLVSLLTTLVCFTCTKLYLKSEDLLIPVCILVNSFSFWGTHYLYNRNFSPKKQSADQQEGTLWQSRPNQEGISKKLKKILLTPKKLLCSYQGEIANLGADPTLFAIFISLSYMVPLFMHSHATPTAYNWLLAIRGGGALLCVGLLLQSQWPTRLLSYFTIYYQFSLLYCLPFVTTFLFLLEGGNMEWIVNVALSIMLLIVLTDWLTFIRLSTIGVFLAIGVYKLGLGTLTENINTDIDTQYTLAYTLTFTTLIGLLFARRKQKRFDSLATQQEQLTIDYQESQDELFKATEEKFRFVTFLKKAGLEKLESVAHLSKELLKLSKQKGNNSEFTPLAQQLTDQLTLIALNMDRFEHRTTGFLLLDGVETVPLEDFLQALQQTLYDKGHKQLKIEVCTQHKRLQCDVEKMKKVILNAVSFIYSVSGEVTKESISLGIKDTQLGYPVDSVSPDHIKKIEALHFTVTTSSNIPEPAALYMSQIGYESIMKPSVLTHMPLLANERIVRAHYGYSNTISEGEKLTLIYIIPVNVREVRSKDMDIPQMQLGAEWPRADDTYTGALEQENAFLQTVKQRSNIDLTLIKKAINLIKDYHGPALRQSGEPFYLHPIAVAQIVLDYAAEETTVLGALLHDTVEDTPLTLEQVELLFNKEVRRIVAGVTHMESNQKTIYKVLLSHPENIHRLWETEDKRVLHVKLADRVHNMRTIDVKSPESQRRTAEETLLFFVPLAKYLGLIETAKELKKRSFDVLGK